MHAYETSAMKLENLERLAYIYFLGNIRRKGGAFGGGPAEQ
jgi:hypothetical protein